MVAVVSQDEELVWSKDRRLAAGGPLETAPGPAVANVRLDQATLVDKYRAAPYQDALTGQPDHALDEVPGCIQRIAHDDDVAAPRRMQAIGELLRDEVVVVIDCRVHCRTQDVDGLVREVDREVVRQREYERAPEQCPDDHQTCPDPR